METLEAILVAEKAIILGDRFLNALKRRKKDTISREEFEALFILEDFGPFNDNNLPSKEGNLPFKDNNLPD